MAEKPSTISDVAAAVGVSKTTISRYLNGKYEYISPETQKRIATVIKDLQYTPSRAARTLKIKKTGVIGCIIADIGNPFSSILVKGVSDMCEQAGYQLLIINTNENPDKERKAIESLWGQDVEGLIINTTGQNNKYLLQLHNQGLPIVMADRGIPGKQIDTIETDNVPTTYEGVRFLEEKGFKSAAFFCEDPTYVTTRMRRCEGFEKGTKEFFAKNQAKVFVLDTKQKDKTAKALEEFLEYPPPRAIFANNGVMVLHILQVMREKGYEVLKDFGLMTYDDWGWMSVTTPSITAIRQNSYEIGKSCVCQVIRRIQNGNKGAPRCDQIPGEIIERDSTQIR